MAGSAVAPSHSGARTPVWLTEGGCWDCGPPAQRTAQVGQPPQGDCSDRKPTFLPAAVPAPSLHVHPLLPPSFPVSCNTSQAHPPQCHTCRDDFLPPLLTLATGTQGQPSYQRPAMHRVDSSTSSSEDNAFPGVRAPGFQAGPVACGQTQPRCGELCGSLFGFGETQKGQFLLMSA